MAAHGRPQVPVNHAWIIVAQFDSGQTERSFSLSRLAGARVRESPHAEYSMSDADQILVHSPDYRSLNVAHA
ncbi:MAG: hypothetical protein ABI790_14830, partial [Betaproteobacteria bacterium]